MRSERGQATFEWIGIVLLVAIALAALTRFAERAEGRSLATTLLHSVIHAASRAPEPQRPAARATRAPRQASFMVPPLVPRPAHSPSGRPMRPGPRFRGLPRLPRPLEAPGTIGRARRGVGLAWRRAWFGCLVYERTRYALLHPESRFPGYTIPGSEALRMANDCISPVDLVRDWPLIAGRGHR